MYSLRWVGNSIEMGGSHLGFWGLKLYDLLKAEHTINKSKKITHSQKLSSQQKPTRGGKVRPLQFEQKFQIMT